MTVLMQTQGQRTSRTGRLSTSVAATVTRSGSVQLNVTQAPAP